MSGHTPGPWVWDGPLSSGEAYRLISHHPGHKLDYVLEAVDGAVYSEYSSDPGYMQVSQENARLIAAAPIAPHECDDPKCPGNVNRRKLEAFDEMLEALMRARDTMIEWYRQDQRDVIGDEQAVKAAHREVASVREINAIIAKVTP